MTSEWVMPRHEVDLLSDELRAIPWLVACLGLVHVGQISRGGHSVCRAGRDEPAPLPFDEHAPAVAAALHNELATWVRLVCNHRGIRFRPLRYTHQPGFIGPLQPEQARTPADYKPTTGDLALWLNRYRHSLALTPGSDTAYKAIRRRTNRARAIISPEPVAVPPTDLARVADARDEEFNARGIENAAALLGEEYRHLTRKRVNNLHQLGHITPVRISSLGVPIYRLGDVLDAHLAVPVRGKDTTRYVDA